MRVIGGKWRGRKLSAPDGDLIRPTTDRTKEALFNILGEGIRGTVVLDLCCGAGGLGVEALSRGASRVYFVDVDRTALAATRRNLEHCAAAEESYRLVQADAVDWLTTQTGRADESWLVLCDPPYSSPVAAAMIDAVNGGLSETGLVAAVVEYGPRTPGMEKLPSAWRERRYGESRLGIYRPQDPARNLEE